MREVFKYCSCADLYQLCVADNELKKSVLECGISGKIIDFSDLVDFPILDVFKMFGKEMTKIKIAERNVVNKPENLSQFDEILRLVSTYCAMDKLKYLDLEFVGGTSVSKRFLYAVLPYLRNIESFVISECDKYVECRRDRRYQPYKRFSPMEFHPTINDFIDCIVANALKMKSIDIRNVQFTGTFFYLQHVRNLETLALDGCHISESDGFISLMEQKPNIKSISWIHSYAPRMTTSLIISKLFVNSVPNLVSFNYHPGHTNSTDDAFRDPFYYINYSNLISKSKQLKVLTIDEIDAKIWNTLVQTNSVQELQVRGAIGGTPVNFSNYTELKCIKVIAHDRYDKITYMEWLPEIPCLTELHLDFYEYFDFSYSVELYSKLLTRFTVHTDSLPLTIYIEKKTVEKLLFELGQRYRKDLIEIRAGAGQL